MRKSPDIVTDFFYSPDRAWVPGIFQFCSMFRPFGLLALLFFLLVEVLPAQPPPFTAAQLSAEEKNVLKGRKNAADSLDGWVVLGNRWLDNQDFARSQTLARWILKKAPGLRKPDLAGEAWNQLGIAAEMQGRMPEAIDFYLKALKIFEQGNLKKPSARTLNNLGAAYYYLQTFSRAESYFRRSLAIYLETRDSLSMADAFSNLGSLCEQTDRFGEALNYHRQSLRINQSLGRGEGMSLSLGNLGVIFTDLGRFDSALVYHRKSLSLKRKLGLGPYSLSLSFSNLGSLFLKTGKLDSASWYVEQAHVLNRRLGSREGMRDDFRSFSEIEEKRGDYRRAFRYYKSFVEISDSLLSQESRDEIATYAAQFEVQKQQYLDSLSRAGARKQAMLRARIEKEERDRIKNIQYFGIVAFVMVVMLSVFFIGRIHLPVLWIEGFIFFSALLIFELLFLFLDPYLETISGGMPVYKFGLNLVLAVMVFYAHSFFEGLLKSKLIRPAAD
jgi:tetratricopeptide (TPR) repeat protein